MKVRVYRNLHRSCWSVQMKTESGWRVWGHARTLRLSDVSFKVGKRGRERVLREQRKNVHAFAQGTLVEIDTEIKGMFLHRITYSPYVAPSFVCNGIWRVDFASDCSFTQDGTVLTTLTEGA